jgi:hypothetical protein
MVADLTGLARRQCLAAGRGDGLRRGDGDGRARGEVEGARVFRGCENCHPAEHRRDADAGAPLGIEVIVGRPGDAGPCSRCLARSSSIRAPMGMCRSRPYRRAARAKGRGDRGDRSSGADPDQGAGRDGGGYRRGLGPAVWRAAGLWRAARGLHRLPRRDEARDARADRRRLGRQPRQQGLPAVACRRGSSISGARRRRRTSARRRRFWR